ncbi:hypothetical protein PGT21_018203 [Puccinia graminis f. sp. tritici]|uniref:Uncharacterized protein n=1 Tax=Puccinia graminis f. sp. tritici TaxID=56615 RepID=A0A5B0QUE6_PUCGR|nr:hypothetical protein PGT21_018203 [Puccinia graminis f. sp. tritici]
MSDANDPFVLSQTKSLRRSIQQIQSPYICIKRNLTQLQSCANLQLRKLQQSASPPIPTNPPAPKPSLPSSTPVNQPD